LAFHLSNLAGIHPISGPVPNTSLPAVRNTQDLQKARKEKKKKKLLVSFTQLWEGMDAAVC